jgi:hypothetical protein
MEIRLRITNHPSGRKTLDEKRGDKPYELKFSRLNADGFQPSFPINEMNSGLRL